jgi:hypothetical protein
MHRIKKKRNKEFTGIRTSKNNKCSTPEESSERPARLGAARNRQLNLSLTMNEPPGSTDILVDMWNAWT